MRWNTRRDTVFRHTRHAFAEAFRQTRDIFKYIKLDHKTFSEEYRIKCPVAILHIKDIWHSTDRRDSIGKFLAKGAALFLSAVIEFPVLVVKSLFVDVITLPLKAVAGFFVDLGELLGNIVSDVASLPAAGMNHLAERPSKEKIIKKEQGQSMIPEQVTTQRQQMEGPNVSAKSDQENRAEESARPNRGRFWSHD